MQLSSADGAVLRDEQELIDGLPLDAARVLELGCGNAARTRRIARSGRIASMLALEVDALQHAKNLTLTDLPQIRFGLGGAEAIPAPNASVDLIFLFKSLHHVARAKLDQAFAEMRRVLVPGGLVYISEPVFDGDYNQILRLFHDEQRVRIAAFEATQRAVASGAMALLSQTFFKARVHFRDFSQFEQNVLKVTHSAHQLTPALHQLVRSRFEAHMTAQGAFFEAPMRVDLLRTQ